MSYYYYCFISFFAGEHKDMNMISNELWIGWWDEWMMYKQMKTDEIEWSSSFMSKFCGRGKKLQYFSLSLSNTYVWGIQPLFKKLCLLCKLIQGGIKKFKD